MIPASLLMLKPLETMVPPLLTKLPPLAPALKMELRTDIPEEPELKMLPAIVELLLIVQFKIGIRALPGSPTL